MINRGDIKLAIDMVVNAQDDNLFGGEAEYVINTLEDCGNTIAAQAAVIEKLRESLNLHHEMGLGLGRDKSDSLAQLIISAYKHGLLCRITEEALAIPSDSTQILAEVRRAEREKCAKVCEAKAAGARYIYQREELTELAAAIRAME